MSHAFCSTQPSGEVGTFLNGGVNPVMIISQCTIGNYFKLKMLMEYHTVIDHWFELRMYGMPLKQRQYRNIALLHKVHFNSLQCSVVKRRICGSSELSLASGCHQNHLTAQCCPSCSETRLVAVDTRYPGLNHLTLF